MRDKIDLHLHSTASDGTFTPTELMELAAREGYLAVALADHDTLQGVAEARARARQLGLIYLPCVELSIGTDVGIHLLAYGVDEKTPRMQAMLEGMRLDREERTRKMAQKLKEAGYAVDYDDVRAKVDGVVGRPHLAQALVECGAAKTVPECFIRFIGKNAPFYVERRKIPSQEGIQTVLEAGGIPTLAHPGQLRLSVQELYAHIGKLRDMGLKGLECYHNSHDPQMQDLLRDYSSRLGLLVTGGSDFHGATKPTVGFGSGTERWLDAMDCLQKLQAALAKA